MMMTQSEIAFTPEVGSEIIGQSGMRWIDFVTGRKRRIRPRVPAFLGSYLRSPFSFLRTERPPAFPDHESWKCWNRSTMEMTLTTKLTLPARFQHLDQLRAALPRRRSCRSP